jgi:hypothetical protein
MILYREMHGNTFSLWWFNNIFPNFKDIWEGTVRDVLALMKIFRWNFPEMCLKHIWNTAYWSSALLKQCWLCFSIWLKLLEYSWNISEFLKHSFRQNAESIWNLVEMQRSSLKHSDKMLNQSETSLKCRRSSCTLKHVSLKHHWNAEFSLKHFDKWLKQQWNSKPVLKLFN